MLNNIGIPGLLLIAIVVLVLFGRGKVSSLMGEVGKGITAFKKGVGEGSKEDDAERADREEERAARAREIAPPEHADTVPPGPPASRVEADATLDSERRRS